MSTVRVRLTLPIFWGIILPGTYACNPKLLTRTFNSNFNVSTFNSNFQTLNSNILKFSTKYSTSNSTCSANVNSPASLRRVAASSWEAWIWWFPNSLSCPLPLLVAAASLGESGCGEEGENGNGKRGDQRAGGGGRAGA